jgi:hypothetical protein
MGVVLTMIKTPQFSTSARILVESKTQTVAISNTENPLGNLLLPSSGHDVSTQVEILRSPMLLRGYTRRQASRMAWLLMCGQWANRLIDLILRRLPRREWKVLPQPYPRFI